MPLFQHQKEGIKFLKEKRRAILADEMGLGKTRQAIVAAGESGAKGTLVICPASLKINWSREIKMVYPEDEVHTIESGQQTDIPPVSWIIINYDMLPKYKEQIVQLIVGGNLDTIIIDEAHYIKGKNTIRAKTTLEITPMIENVYALTGTPIMNRPIELFNILRAIKHPLGRARTVYAKRYCGAYMKTIIRKNGQVIRFNDESGATHLEELREFTKGNLLRRLKKDVLDLPEKIISVQITDLTKVARKEYDTAFDAYIEWVQNNPELEKDIEGILDARHLVELMKLKQVCSRAKLDRMVEDIRNAVSQGQKVIVFSQFTGTIMKLKEMLSEGKRGSKYDDAKEPILAVTLTGQDDMKTRQGAVDMFQSGPAQVFISNIKAGGVGITLTAASIVMFADMEWSPSLHDQAEDRAHRIGQGNTVNVYYYVAVDTIEEDIVTLLEEKRTVIRQLMDGDHKERWAKEMDRIGALQDEDERTKALEVLTEEMNKASGGGLSMAAAFLDRMRERLHIHN
jgi:SWI/SNF-related matrix-associated actin-dependent regulator 1 of chromatin subfamily A